MRRSIRSLIVAAGLTVALAGLALPANAALTVRALWNMDSLPTMVDSAGGDNNGTTSNITLVSGAYSFNGTSSVATSPDRPNLNPGTTDIRLTARISTTSVPRSSSQTYDVVRKGLTTSSGGYYKLEIRRSSTGLAVPACHFKDSSGRIGEAVSTVGLANRGFVTVACTKTSSGVTVNVAGQEVTAHRKLGSISNTAPVYVGAKGNGTDWFPGLMDFVKIEIG